MNIDRVLRIYSKLEYGQYTLNIIFCSTDHVTRQHEGRGLIYECWLCRDRGSTANFYRQAALDKHMTDAHKIQVTH